MYVGMKEKLTDISYQFQCTIMYFPMIKSKILDVLLDNVKLSLCVLIVPAWSCKCR